jgi:hypothetical protein
MQQTAREHWSYSQLNQLLRICSLQFAFQRIHISSLNSSPKPSPSDRPSTEPRNSLGLQMDGKDVPPMTWQNSSPRSGNGK